MADKNSEKLTGREVGAYIQMLKDTRLYVKDIHKMVKLQNGRVRSLEINKADDQKVEKIREEIVSQNKTLYKIVGIGLAVSFFLTPVIAILAMNFFGGKG